MEVNAEYLVSKRGGEFEMLSDLTEMAADVFNITKTDVIEDSTEEALTARSFVAYFCQEYISKSKVSWGINNNVKVFFRVSSANSYYKMLARYKREIEKKDVRVRWDRFLAMVKRESMPTDTVAAKVLRDKFTSIVNNYSRKIKELDDQMDVSGFEWDSKKRMYVETV